MEAKWIVPTAVYVLAVGGLGVLNKLALRTLNWQTLVLWTGIGYILVTGFSGRRRRTLNDVGRQGAQGRASQGVARARIDSHRRKQQQTDPAYDEVHRQRGAHGACAGHLVGRAKPTSGAGRRVRYEGLLHPGDGLPQPRPFSRGRSSSRERSGALGLRRPIASMGTPRRSTLRRLPRLRTEPRLWTERGSQRGGCRDRARPARCLPTGVHRASRVGHRRDESLGSGSRHRPTSSKRADGRPDVCGDGRQRLSLARFAWRGATGARTTRRIQARRPPASASRKPVVSRSRCGRRPGVLALTSAAPSTA